MYWRPVTLLVGALQFSSAFAKLDDLHITLAIASWAVSYKAFDMFASDKYCLNVFGDLCHFIQQVLLIEILTLCEPSGNAEEALTGEFVSYVLAMKLGVLKVLNNSL